MPRVSADVWVPLPPEHAFAVSQTTGELRLRWDPFIRQQHLLDADAPGVGVRTFTRARLGSAMVSRYVSCRPPTSVGMTMDSGPWFFASFGGGWRFTPERRGGLDGTRASWKYTFSTRPSWLSPVPTGSAMCCWAARSVPGSPPSHQPARTPGSWPRRGGDDSPDVRGIGRLAGFAKPTKQVIPLTGSGLRVRAPRRGWTSAPRRG